MADYIDVGRRIAALRKEQVLTQEKLVELIGEERLSLSTLKRIETGKSKIDLARAFYICRALGCNSHDLIKDSDDKREAIKAAYQEEGGELDEDDFWNIEDSLMRLALCYPQVPEDMLYKRFAITNLMQFIVYLPLIPPAELYYSLLKIDGDAFDREYYVLSQLEFLYRKIPESNAKKYADLMVARFIIMKIRRIITFI